jgi:hypothetical protein
LEDGGIVRNYRVEVWFNSPTGGSEILKHSEFVPKLKNLVCAIEAISAAVSYLVSHPKSQQFENHIFSRFE